MLPSRPRGDRLRMRRFELPCRPSAGRSRGSPRDNRPQPGSVDLLVAVGILVGLGVGAALALAAVAFRSGSKLGAARRMRQQILGEARREADALRREAQIEAREQAVRLRAELEEELAARRGQVVKSEERLKAKEEEAASKLVEAARREQGLADRETHMKQLQEDLKRAKQAELEELERISSMTIGEAKAHLLERSEELVRHELARRVRQPGEQAVFEAHCGDFHEELVKILGRLRYRTSYGQNVLKHTLEVVHLAGIMATELEASVKTAKRAALLHDLGKAMTHEVEGSHAGISAQLAKRYGESQGVVHAIEAHHYEVQPQTVEAVLLIAADAISAARPGARGESLENYIKRLAALEELAAQKPGVDKVYALQAGREIRVIVRPGDVDDDGAILLSHEIAREIEDQLEYPGQVKVTVIRESRAIDVARNVTNGGGQHERLPAAG